MKNIFAFIILCVFSAHCLAQTDSAVSTDNHVVYLDIPQKMNIKDKIILRNSSPYAILQAVVVLESTGETYSATCVNPGNTFTMVYFDDNKLKKYRGTRIAVKVKGVKKILGDVSTTNIDGGGFAAGVGARTFGVTTSHTEIKAEEVNNVDPKLVTYDFNVTLSEMDHDLYVTVTSGSTKSALDF